MALTSMEYGFVYKVMPSDYPSADIGTAVQGKTAPSSRFNEPVGPEVSRDVPTTQSGFFFLFLGLGGTARVSAPFIDKGTCVLSAHCRTPGVFFF